MRSCLATTLLLFCLLITANLCVANTRYHEKILPVDGSAIHYFQIGHGSPIVFIHGLFANKEQWLPFINTLTHLYPHFIKQHQLIIPDLPGYGESLGFPITTYNLTCLKTEHCQHSERHVLHDFLTKLHLAKPFDLAGNSMGGLLMTLYAKQFPKEVHSLAFIGSPLGVIRLTPSFYQKSFRRGFNPFIPTTIAQFTTEIKLLVANYKAIIPSNKQIIGKILTHNVAQYQRLSIIFNMVNTPRYLTYLTHSQSLAQPILVLWGTQDHIFGSSSHGQALCQVFTHSKKCLFHPIAHAGHVISLEAPRVLAHSVRIYDRFLRGLKSPKDSIHRAR